MVRGLFQFIGHEAPLRAERHIRGDPPKRDRVFGLKSGRAISNRIQAAARAAGLKGDFRGHSPESAWRRISSHTARPPRP